MKLTKKLLVIYCIMVLLNIAAYGASEDIFSAAEDICDNGLSYGETDVAMDYGRSAADSLSPQNLFSYLSDCITDVLSGNFSTLLVLLAGVFLCAVIQAFTDSLGSLSGTLDTVLHIFIMLICFEMVTPLILSVGEYLEAHCAFMLSVSGTNSVLLATSGLAGSGAAASVSSAFIISFIQICSVYVILPAVKLTIVLSTVGAISKSMDLSGIIGFLRSFCLYGTGLLFAVFLGVHSVAVGVSAGGDSLAMRGLRFTFARMIPVAGGMISESIKTVLSGMNMIKGAAGGIGIAYILYSLIPTVLPVLAVKLAVVMALNISRLFGIKRQSVFLDGMNSSCSLLFAICCFAAFAGIIIIAVFMNTAITL